MYGYSSRCGVSSSCSAVTCACQGPAGPQGPQGPQGPPGPAAPLRPFLSSFIEALGDEQSVPTGGNIAFSDYDIVGPDIAVNAAGDEFTIHRPGLYHIEWSINLTEENTSAAVVGLVEEGEPISGMSNSATVGNMSSGALINVETVPYTFNLHNYGGPLEIGRVGGAEFTAASIRILRFADGPLA